MNKEQLKELATTLAAIADGAEWEWAYIISDYYQQPCANVGPMHYIQHGNRIRLKPRTIRIGEYDVPEPVREPLKYGQAYYLAAPESSDYCFKGFEWDGCSPDHQYLKRGLIHLTQEAAALHGKALASFTERKEGK